MAPKQSLGRNNRLARAKAIGRLATLPTAWEMGETVAQLKQLPLVSVIVPAHNAERFIGQTLNSILAQTHQELEVIVVDDGSTDSTPRILADFAARDRRVVALRQTNRGVAAARNAAIAKSRGAYIAPADADDIWFPTKIERQLEESRRTPAPGMVYCWTVNIDEEGCLTGGYMANGLSGHVYEALVYHNFVGSASVPLIRRDCLYDAGLYDTTLREQGGQGCEDWDLCLRVAERHRVSCVPQFLVAYRQLEGSMSCQVATMERSYHLLLDRIKRSHPGLPRRLFRWSSSLFHAYMAAQCQRCGDNRGALWQLLKAVRYDLRLLGDRRFCGMGRRTMQAMISAGYAAAGQRWETTEAAQALLTPELMERINHERKCHQGLTGRGQKRMERICAWADKRAWAGKMLHHKPLGRLF